MLIFPMVSFSVAFPYCFCSMFEGSTWMYSELVLALFDDCLSDKDLTAFKVVALVFGCFWKMSQALLVAYLSVSLWARVLWYTKCDCLVCFTNLILISARMSWEFTYYNPTLAFPKLFHGVGVLWKITRVGRLWGFHEHIHLENVFGLNKFIYWKTSQSP